MGLGGKKKLNHFQVWPARNKIHHVAHISNMGVCCTVKFYCCGFWLSARHMKWQKDRSSIGSDQQEPFRLHSHTQSCKPRTKMNMWEVERSSTQKNPKQTTTKKNPEKTRFGKVSEVLQWQECILCNCLTVIAYFSSQFYAEAIPALQTSLPKYMGWDKWGGKVSFYGVLRQRERLKSRSKNSFVWLNILLEIGFKDLAALAQRSGLHWESPSRRRKWKFPGVFCHCKASLFWMSFYILQQL